MTMDELAEELRRNEAEYFGERVSRLGEIEAWLEGRWEHLSFGPEFEGVGTFQEARFAYVYGLWMSAIVMSLTAIERHVAQRLVDSGVSNAERMNIKDLIERAKSAGFVTLEQADEINRLREVRNDFTHFRRESRFWKTVWALMDKQRNDEAESTNFNLILHKDAKIAVQL